MRTNEKNFIVNNARSLMDDSAAIGIKKAYHMIRPNRSQYGGCTDITFEARGFFYLHRDRRWWFVDPDGNAFLALGTNHIEPGRAVHDYNRAYWANRFGLEVDAPLPSFLPGLTQKVKQDCAAFGFNSLGCHNPDSWYSAEIPYIKRVEFLKICHYMHPTRDDFLDVWGDGYRLHVDRLVDELVAPCKDDPYLMGYFMTACPIYTELEAAARPNCIHGMARPASPTWPNVLRNLDASEPGKQKYLAFIRERYGDSIEAFNDVYDTEFTSFADLERRNWRPGVDQQNAREIEDNSQFLFMIVDQAYRTQTEAIRRVDGNHLIFGDKLNGNADTRDEVVTIAGKYFDLIFYGYYAFYDDHKALLDRWSKLTDKPFFSADASINVPSREVPSPFGPHCPTQEDRAERTHELLAGCFSRDDFVGWHWCGWMDQWHVGETPLGKQHGGLQDPFGNYHLPMLHVFSQFSALMYDRAL